MYLDTTNDNAMYKRGKISPKCPTKIVYTNGFREVLRCQREEYRLHYHINVEIAVSNRMNASVFSVESIGERCFDVCGHREGSTLGFQLPVLAQKTEARGKS